ncbi:WhiB family transcriptional regulator [Rhodococcus pseudokoreensis]|uniref:Transcriptional regulator WhiB n=1 Tax=Rhodococcus pseudokoreensis TaxID=2811421 RepID=A0A974W5K4_9NOCA|nr:WhiB family transcriptional regulator [Rhodococcus pseudokoreensis]QSE90783.1 WhiB family transcriptional regulator [Rhodococcus pseudokoreensis]
MTDLEWQQFARCKNIGADTFYPPDNEEMGTRLRRERAAKQICGPCVVRMQCRMHALLAAERYGVWGGLTESERRRVKRPYRFEPDLAATTVGATEGSGR